MKIVSAVNAMIANPKLISNVLPGAIGSEIYFMYMQKYKWSVSEISDSHTVFYYPTDVPLETLASWDENDWQQVSSIYVRYSAKEIGSREALDTFAELYRVVKERQFGIIEVLDDIIENADWTSPAN